MSLALDTNTGGLVAAMEARFASRDERTTARLDWWVKVAGRCYGCHAHVSDEVAALHPGVCATCHRRKKLKPLAIPAEFGLAIVRDHAPAHDAPANQEPPEGGEEEAMPKGATREPKACCGSLGQRHKMGCEKAGAGKAIDVPVTRKAPALAQRAARPAAARVVGTSGRPPTFCDPTTLDVGQLVSTIEACREELERRQVDLQAQLATVVEALGGGA